MRLLQGTINQDGRSYWRKRLLLFFCCFPIGARAQGLLPILISAGEMNPHFRFTDAYGGHWSPDVYFGGRGSSSSTVKQNVLSTFDDVLFQTQRYGNDLQYAIPVPPGHYTVTLYLAEMSYSKPRSRIFDVIMEGVIIEDDLDMVALAGRRRMAIVIRQDVAVSDGLLNIEFQPVRGTPTVAGIKVDTSSGSVGFPSPSLSSSSLTTTPKDDEALPVLPTMNSSSPEAPSSRPSPTTEQFPLLISAGETNPSFGFVDSYNGFWTSDAYFTGLSTPAAHVARKVSQTFDDSIFRTQRHGTNIQYAIPVPSGEYKVTLFMAEMSLRRAGQRVFDIVMEGAVVRRDFDMIRTAGRRRAIMVEEDTTVTDGTLNIELSPKIGTPTIAGIKVVRSNSIETKKRILLSPSPSSMPNPFPSEPSPAPPTASVKDQILINAGALERVVFDDLQNANKSSEIWQPDEFFGAETKTGSTSKPIRWTQKDEIYQTWREGPLVKYKIPVANGSYKVTLYFSENFHETPRSRVFDVLIEQRVALESLDLIEKQGGKDRRAFSLDFTTEVIDGAMEIECVAKVGEAIVNAIQIDRIGPLLAQAVAGGPYVAVDVNNVGSARVSLDGSLSSTKGPDLNVTSWNWTIDGEKIASDDKPALDLPVGEHAVTLRVVDSGGNRAEDSTLVTVLEFGYPVLYSMSPDDGDTIGGERVTLSGTGFNFTEYDTVVQFGMHSLSGPSQITVVDEYTIVVKESPSVVVGKPVRVSVQTPLGLSNVLLFSYTAKVPIAFESGVVTNPMMPTAIAFGPDGKMYVSSFMGSVLKMTLDENYTVTETVVSNAIAQAHDQIRPIMGIAFDPMDTKEHPDVYISHSTIYHGDSPALEGASLNGKVSKLVGPELDSIVDVVTGLPVSNHDHAVNSIVFGNNGDLFIQLGGSTDAGVTGEVSELGMLEESHLGAAILVAHMGDPNFNGTVTYDASGVITAGSGVDLFASSKRNSVDMVLHSSGKLYGTDGVTEMYHGQVASELSALLPPSTNGAIEFESDHFRGQLRGQLILGQFGGQLFQVALDEAGEKIRFRAIQVLRVRRLGSYSRSRRNSVCCPDRYEPDCLPQASRSTSGPAGNQVSIPEAGGSARRDHTSCFW